MDSLRFLTGVPDASLLYEGSYQPGLVVLSVGIAILASFTALHVVGLIAATQGTRLRHVWLAVGAAVMGGGIWAMHFIGMLAFSLPCGVRYDPLITLASMAPGMLASAVALKLLSRETLSWRQLVEGGILLGAGIGAMHYSGMAALRLNALLRYDPLLFALSIVVAVLLAVAALGINFRLRRRDQAGGEGVRIAAATVMGLAVSGMHYTAMGAAYFLRDGDPAAATSSVDPIVLAVTTSVVTMVLIALTGISSVAGRYMVLSHDLQAAIQERQRTEEALQESDAYNRVLFAASHNALVVMDAATGCFLDCNEAAIRIYGFSRREDVLGRTPLDLSAPTQYGGVDSASAAVAKLKACGEHGSLLFEWRHRRPDGQIWDAEIHLMAFEHRGRRLMQFSLQDITDRKRVTEQLRLSHAAIAHAHEGVLIADAEGRILDVNPAFTDITGYRRDEVLGCNPRVLKSGRHDYFFYRAFWQSLAEDGYWQGEIWNRRKNGEIFPQLANISGIRDAEGQISHYVELFTDITQIKESQSRLEHLAYFDPLTHLPNRALLTDRIRQAIARAERAGGQVAVCYLDLDGFKPVNDTWGHATGDKLLIEIAQRLKQAVRGGDTISRLGGDEFVLLLSDLAGPKEVDQTLQRVLAAVAAPFVVGTDFVSLTASLGVTMYPHDGDDPDTLIRYADQAMYAAKQAGKNRVCRFDAELDRRTRAHREVISRIEEGLVRNEFRLHYQPKVDMRRGTVIGAEALIRWQHPEQGLLSPIMFLPVVENTDFAISLGEWVIREALRQMSAWAEQGLELPVSVNISGGHLQQDNFVSSLARILAEYPRVRPEWLELEVLETTAMEDVEQVSLILKGCAALGVRFALDDFGTGYSSLTYFRRLPASVLKIDQSFVRDMLDDREDMLIVEGVVALAATFGRQVIAEGVETPEHGIPLMQFGCDLAQGYAIARPMPAERIPAWVQGWEVPPEWRAMAAVSCPREDLPLLLAEVQHRRWIDRIINACHPNARNLAVPPLDPRECGFGQWFYGVGRDRYGELPAFQALEPAHFRVHAIGHEVIALCAGNPEAARARTCELRAAGEVMEREFRRLRIDTGVEPAETAIR